MLLPAPNTVLLENISPSASSPQPPPPQQQHVGLLRPPPTAVAASAAAQAVSEGAVEQQDTARLMAELHESMKESFRNSISKVSRKKADALEQRLVQKQATDAERSSLLRTMAALRGQRYRMTRRFDTEEQERVAKIPASISPIHTKWGEMVGGDSKKVPSTGDGDTWLTASLGAKEKALVGFSDLSETLALHMPPLADIARQREQLEEERQALSAQLEVRIVMSLVLICQ